MPKPQKPDYETKNVRFTEHQPPKSQDAKELEDIILKMHNLTVRDPKYAVLYVTLGLRFLSTANPFPPPELVPAANHQPQQTLYL